MKIFIEPMDSLFTHTHTHIHPRILIHTQSHTHTHTHILTCTHPSSRKIRKHVTIKKSYLSYSGISATAEVFIEVAIDCKLSFKEHLDWRRIRHPE